VAISFENVVRRSLVTYGFPNYEGKKPSDVPLLKFEIVIVTVIVTFSNLKSLQLSLSLVKITKVIVIISLG